MPYLVKDGIPQCRKAGVYCIVNKVNGKVYVGSAMTIRGRTMAHRSYLRRGRHDNPHLQHAWSKYGETNFRFDILETCEPGDCVSREQYWIDALNSAHCHYGYNRCPTAGSRYGVVLSEETKAKISAANKGRKASPEAKAKMAEARKHLINPMHIPEVVAKFKTCHWSKGPRAVEIAAKIALGNRRPCSAEKRANISRTKIAQNRRKRLFQ